MIILTALLPACTISGNKWSLLKVNEICGVLKRKIKTGPAEKIYIIITTNKVDH